MKQTKKKTKPPPPPEVRRRITNRLAPQSSQPSLRFSPTAWAKLLWFRDRGYPKSEHEIGGFGIASTEDPLLIEDFQTVNQDVTVVSVVFEDQAVADFFDQQFDAGRQPEQFSRIWIHTHPGDSPLPSQTDEETFERVFGRCDWAVMLIIARGGATYCRLRFNTGPGADIEIPVQVDYTLPFAGADHEAWEDEYRANIKIDTSWRFASDDPALTQDMCAFCLDQGKCCPCPICDSPVCTDCLQETMCPECMAALHLHPQTDQPLIEAAAPFESEEL